MNLIITNPSVVLLEDRPGFGKFSCSLTNPGAFERSAKVCFHIRATLSQGGIENLLAQREGATGGILGAVIGVAQKACARESWAFEAPSATIADIIVPAASTVEVSTDVSLPPSRITHYALSLVIDPSLVIVRDGLGQIQCQAPCSWPSLAAAEFPQTPQRPTYVGPSRIPLLKPWFSPVFFAPGVPAVDVVSVDVESWLRRKSRLYRFLRFFFARGKGFAMSLIFLTAAIGGILLCVGKLKEPLALTGFLILSVEGIVLTLVALGFSFAISRLGNLAFGAVPRSPKEIKDFLASRAPLTIEGLFSEFAP